MTYLGNPALAPDVQKRILGTFEQTLDLAAAGSRQEALLGCDFVLRMDPQFVPARKLQERLQASAGAILIEDLRGGGALGEPAPLPALDADADLGFAFLPDLEELPTAAVGGSSLRAELERLAAEHRFSELIEMAQANLAAVQADPALAQLATAAQEKLETAPYVEKFLASARDALSSGRSDEAKKHLDKARALDPTHPEIAKIESASFDLGAAAAFTSFAAPAGEPFGGPEFASIAPSSGDSESDRRIASLLGEGQKSLDSGDIQGAIDSWSRIFLIDIDHPEAARRIEQARRVKAESERQVEEIFHEGLASLDAGDLGAARQSFERVVALAPNHLAAREQLQLIEAGQVPAARPAAPRPAAVAESGPVPRYEEPAASGDLKEEILVPPDDAAQAPKKAKKKVVEEGAAPAKDGKGRKKFALIGAAAALLLVAGGAYVFLNRDSLFPNSEEAAPAPAQDPIVRAQKLYESDKVALAISMLKRIAPGDANHAKAQELIAKWSSELPQVAPTGPPPEQVAIRDAFLADARTAYTGRAYLRAAELFAKANAVAPLTGPDADLYTDARQQLVPMAAQIQLFKDHEYEMVLPQLWRLREASPDSPDVKRLLVDSYYNLGIRELQQRRNPSEASEHFQQALSIAPEDAEIQRHDRFAKAYRDRTPDLLYNIYVKYLPSR